MNKYLLPKYTICRQRLQIRYASEVHSVYQSFGIVYAVVVGFASLDQVYKVVRIRDIRGFFYL